MRNVHTRDIAAPIEQIRPWIEAGWTATSRDPFPRDVIRTWRKNPPHEDPLALIPHVTRLGHGPFSFRFEEWDGNRWRVSVDTAGYSGWHGFDLRPTPDGCLVVHTLELELAGPSRVVWPVCFAAIHDWAVEAIFDRIEEALSTGTMPVVTRRTMPWPLSTALGLLRRVLRRHARTV